jgi:hypothetical protein
MKNISILLFLLLSFSFLAQEKYAREVSILSDNDLYVSLSSDRYYTNGLFLSYKYLSKNIPKNLEKKIFEWQLGHEMFSPYKAITTDKSRHDRPFAAHFFINFNIKNVYKSNQILTFGGQFGVIGRNAYGEELQNFIHDLYRFKPAAGWEFQVKNAVSINLKANYINHLATDKKNLYDLNMIAGGRIGTVYTDFSAGLYSRIGFLSLQKMANSIAFSTHLNSENTRFTRAAESFFYLQPTFHYIFYDATLEGSFLNTGSPVTKKPNSIGFELEIGLKFTVNRFNFAYGINYQSNKTSGLRYSNGYTYGRISIHYLLH